MALLMQLGRILQPPLRATGPDGVECASGEMECAHGSAFCSLCYESRSLLETLAETFFSVCDDEYWIAGCEEMFGVEADVQASMLSSYIGSFTFIG